MAEQEPKRQRGTGVFADEDDDDEEEDDILGSLADNASRCFPYPKNCTCFQTLGWFSRALDFGQSSALCQIPQHYNLQDVLSQRIALHWPAEVQAGQLLNVRWWCRYERPASANAASSFSFAGEAAASGMYSTPRLPEAEHAAQQQHDSEYPPPDEAEGPVVVCHCGLACNKLAAKTEKNMGRWACCCMLHYRT